MEQSHERERASFRHYLRTGRRLPPPVDAIELKFNPYHDPRNGQFTFAPGGPKSATASPRGAPQAASPTTRSSVKVARRAEKPPLPYLSSTHNEIRSLAAKYPPAPGTNEWTVDDLAAWEVGGKNIHDFKAQWVRGYRDAIKAAADRFDLPRELVAGVAYTEVGGDPLSIDSLAYSLRSDVKRDRTSFGDASLQVRRAAQSLGYGTYSDKMTESQRRMVIASLEQPQTGIFVAAKHLADLRDRDFKGRRASQLGRQQVEIIASRYNRGSELPIEKVKENLDYGKDITRRWAKLGDYIR